MAMMASCRSTISRSNVDAAGSQLVLEFIEFKGVGETKSLPSRVQDPGSYRLQLNVRDIDETLTALKQAGSPSFPRKVRRSG
jgi:hypothetical protein